jgi:outer membrane protein OmpA-like peptidoglycan-associated protein
MSKKTKFALSGICFFISLIDLSAQSDSIKDISFLFTDSVFETNTIYRSYDLLYLFPSSRAWPDSTLYHILNPLIEFLQKHKEIKIEIGYHADIRGVDSVNLHFSELRAFFIVSKLIQFGCDSAQITAKGYGETMPIYSEQVLFNSSINFDEREKMFLANHRIELKIVGTSKSEN